MNKKNRIRSRRYRRMLRASIDFLPHIFTLGNAFFGFVALIMAARGELDAAAWCIFLGAIMDGLDGRLARLVGVSSAFGMQLDSLADAVTFCVAPAFLFYCWKMHAWGIVGCVLCSLFALAGISRLARFNVIAHLQTTYYLGLPTTIAAACAISLLLNRDVQSFSCALLAPYLLMLSLAMVSTIPFLTFKQLHLRPWQRRIAMLGACMLFVWLVVFGLYRCLFILLHLYFLVTLVWYVLQLMRRWSARFTHRPHASFCKPHIK